MTEVPAPIAADTIIAKPSRDYRWRRFLLVLFIFGYGLFSLYDGFYEYPKENAAAKAKGLEALPRPGFDVQFNQAFGIILPPASIAFLIWILYASRGVYRLDGNTLTVPGHNPISLSAIHTINRAKWDRKGIAYLHYEIPGNPNPGIIKLDDFVYQRQPTDEIFARAEAALASVPSPGTPGEG